MSVQVIIPAPLRRLTGNKDEVSASGGNIKEVFQDLEKQYPGIWERLYGEDGSIRRFVNVYVNEEEIRFLNGEETKVKEGDRISIIPAIAGGSAGR